MNYLLETEKVVEKIICNSVCNVCIQLPDGLKPYASEIQKQIELNTGAIVFIWAGSCFGACDIPLGLEISGIDLLVQWGHSQ